MTKPESKTIDELATELRVEELELEIGRYRDALRRIAKRTRGSEIAKICEEALKTTDPDYA